MMWYVHRTTFDVIPGMYVRTQADLYTRDVEPHWNDCDTAAETLM